MTARAGVAARSSAPAPPSHPIMKLNMRQPILNLFALGGIVCLMLLGSLLFFSSNVADLAEIDGSTSIHQLDAEADRYDGRTVQIAGVVDDRVGVLGIGGFRLRAPDGRTTILVLSDSGIPAPNTRLTVNGIYREVIVYGSFHLGVIVPASWCKKAYDERPQLAELICHKA